MIICTSGTLENNKGIYSNKDILTIKQLIEMINR